MLISIRPRSARPLLSSPLNSAAFTSTRIPLTPLMWQTSTRPQSSTPPKLLEGSLVYSTLVVIMLTTPTMAARLDRFARPFQMLMLFSVVLIAPFIFNGCMGSSRYVLTDDAGTAFAIGARQTDEMIDKEKRGSPPPEKTWCIYWRLRFSSLQRLVANGSDFAGPSRQLITYIKRRRAEEGLPPCNRPMIIIFKNGRAVPSEVPPHLEDRMPR